MVEMSDKMEQFLTDLVSAVGTLVTVNDNLRDALRRVVEGSYNHGYNDGFKEAVKSAAEQGYIKIH